jgi:hypothetical protein
MSCTYLKHALICLFTLLMPMAHAQTPPALKPGITLYRIEISFSSGQNIGTRKAGLLCAPDGSMRWSAEWLAHAKPALYAFLAAHHIPTADTQAGEFGIAAPQTDLIVNGFIEEAHISICFTHPGFGLKRFGIDGAKLDKVKGGGELHVHWKIFSQARNALVLEAQTIGASDGSMKSENGVGEIVEQMLTQALAHLLEQPNFQALVKPQT